MFRLAPEPCGERDIRDLDVEAPAELGQRAKLVQLAQPVEPVARDAPPRDDEARPLEITEHPGRPAGAESRFANGRRVHARDLNTAVSRMGREVGAKLFGRSRHLLRRRGSCGPQLAVEIPAPFLVARPPRIENEVDVQRRLVDPHRQIRALRAESVHDCARHELEERTELGGLYGLQLPQRLAMVLGLDDDGSHPERADAMLGAPGRGLGDQPTWDRDAPGGRIAGQAAFDVRYGADVPSRP